jgi:hypothetical protein
MGQCHRQNILWVPAYQRRVVSLTDYGAFVELEEGIEGPDSRF